MKKFISQIIIYVCAFIVLLFIFDFSTSSIIDSNATFVLEDNPKYIVIGHSHPECAFNDSLIDNFKNLGESVEAYFYTYFKVKKVLEQNPYIETVFIDYSTNQLVEEANLRIWNEKYIINRYVKLSPFMTIPEKKILAKNNFTSFFKSGAYIAQNRITEIATNNYNYTEKVGGYRNLSVSKIDSLLKTDYKSLENKYETSKVNIRYLEKTIELCQNYNKEVVLIRCPVHRVYSLNENDSLLHHIQDSLFKEIPFFDFSNFPLLDNEFADFGHLNYKGAKKFSVWFNTFIKEGNINKNSISILQSGILY